MKSRAYAVDLMQSIGEKTALASHLEEHIIDGHDVQELIQSVLLLRRKQMEQLMAISNNPNPKYWCDFKHAVKAFTLDAEVYEADSSEESLQNLKNSADILAGITSLFLGMEFASCARCLYDQMLVNEKIKENNNG